ncbi:unnamed protein product [Rhizoctonia solani]|uniref:HNH nuclease domain-containing protein n=1 Tax=Rhizoctonia solani TaxID=456999 RepID=A0A8H3AXJ5_9AGAM|nr:unnamed protein product [Rhizoctonia solani]
MASQTNAEITALSVGDLQLGEDNITDRDSDPMSTVPRSNNWWLQATSASHKTVTKADQEALEKASRLGRRCVLTGESRSVEMVHLIRKATKSGHWFPIRKSGWDYHFLPLALASDGDQCVISRKKFANDMSSDLNIYDHYLPPYDNLPKLRLHVHPYAVILNAYPKIRKWMEDERSLLPEPVSGYFIQIEFVYTTLTDLFKQHQSSGLSGYLLPSTSGGSDANTEASTPSVRKSQRHQPPTAAPGTRQDMGSSHSGSGAQDSFDDLFDGSKSDSERLWNASDKLSHKSLTASTSNHSHTPPKNIIPASVFDVSPLALDKAEITGWVAGVAHACGSDAPLEPGVDSSSEMEQYASEPARPPPTLDWHDWKSEFAPWWVLLPKRKERGVLSSNDWVEIRNRPPLTRRLESFQRIPIPTLLTVPAGDPISLDPPHFV